MSRDRVFSFFSILTKIGLAGILFFIPISNALIDSFVGIVLCGFIGKKITKPDFQWLKTKQNIFLGLFILFMALSLINSGQYINKSLMALFFKWGKFIALFLIFQDSIGKRRNALIFVIVFLFSSALVALSGITQYFWSVEFLRGRSLVTVISGVKAITSSFSYYNGLGAYLIIPFTLCVAFLEAPGFFRKKLFYLIFILGAILIFCIFHTYSRGSWIGVLTSLLFMLLVSHRRKVLLIFIIVLAVISLFSVFRDRFFFIFQIGGDSDRFKYWQVAIGMFKDHPFLGRGLGTFMSHYAEYLPGMGVFYAHNCFLQILAESGIFSLVSFLLFIGSALYAGIRRFFSNGDSLLLGLICGLVGFLVHSFFEVNLYSLPLAVLFWLMFGLMVAVTKLEN